MDWLRGFLETDWTFIEADGRRRGLTTRIRLYLPREIADLLEMAGLAVEAIHGDFEGGSFGIDSFRLIATARKA